MGYYEEILRQIKDYWGGMLKKGAVTFWEEYDPNAPQEEQYDMYGDKFGKSLCHAWAAGRQGVHPYGIRMSSVFCYSLAGR